MEERRKRSGQARAIRAKRRRQNRVYKQNRTGMLWVSSIVVVLLLVVSVRIFGLYQKNQELKAKEAEVTAVLEEEKQRQGEIAQYEKDVTSPEYIEQLAKSKLGLLYPNEIVFKEEKKEP